MRLRLCLPIAVVSAASFVSSQAPPSSPAARELHEAAFVMDAHVHMINRQFHLGGRIGDRHADGQVDLPRLRDAGMDAFFFTLYVQDEYFPQRYETKQTFRLMELALAQIESHADQIEIALTAADIPRINRAGKMAAILDLEGNFDLDGDLLLLRSLHRLGLRSAMLPAHNSANNFADACCAPPAFGGLNAHGREVIREMNRLGMVINVAHGSNDTILQAVEASTDPILFSHGGFRHFVNIDRSISDEAARAIAAKGGVIALHFGNSFNNPVVLQVARAAAAGAETAAALVGLEAAAAAPGRRQHRGARSAGRAELSARAGARS